MYHKEALHFTAFFHDITDRKQLIESLKETLHVAEAANKAKSDFIANMSHELRTPMNAIIGFVELALRDNLSPKQYNYLDKAKYASHSLLSIINDILDVSKIESGKFQLNPVEFNLDDVFDYLVSLFSTQVSEKELELIIKTPANYQPILFGDDQRLKQILINLIRNAIKFTENGTIFVQVEPSTPTPDPHNPDCLNVIIQFSIQDTGIGINPTQLPQLFNPFVQADSSTTRKFGGTGLGLTICKQLVSMMQGTIGAVSQLGTGSTFRFSVQFEQRGNHSRQPKELPEHLKNTRILIIDDNPLVGENLQEVLKKWVSVSPQVIASGEKALLELLAYNSGETPYHLVLVDWQLPGMDGISTSREIVEKLTTASQHHLIPKIIMMLALEHEAIQQEARNAGVTGFLDKPFTHSQVFNRIMTTFDQPIDHYPKPIQIVANETQTKQEIQGARILLVEDNAINQEIALELLTGIGLIVSIANNGQEALELLEQDTFDLILMDVQMPVMNGYQATQLIRQDARFNTLPIIAMTAHVLTDEQKHCFDVGMNDHLPKPVRPERLYGLLTQWIGTSQLFCLSRNVTIASF